MEDRELAMRMGIAYDRDVILGTIMVVVLLEATRRVAGLALPIIAGLSIAYAFLGRYMPDARSEEHTSELQSLMRISYAVFCLKKKKIRRNVMKSIIQGTVLGVVCVNNIHCNGIVTCP